MCISIGTMLMAGMQVLGGISAQKAAKEQAAEERDAAKAEAETTRKAGERQRKAATAAYGASGVVVNEGTAQDVQDEITADYEKDAMMQVLTGERRARVAERKGKQALMGSLLGAGTAVAGGWKSATPMMTRDDRQGF